MKFRNSFMAVVALVAFVGTTLVASAQESLTLYQGAQINARMRTPIDTGKAHVGDRFVMDVVPPYPSGNPAFQGAIIAGEVTSVTPAGQGRKPSIGLQFDYLRLADGSTVDISATMTQDQRKQEEKSGVKVALSTLGGMLLGNAIGKTIFHTGGGGILGAAGGLLYGINGKTNFTLPAGSNVQITLNQTVTIRRQAPNTQQ
ncbi:MAG TPA: hypothetical protein VMF11_07485 [Candidatus Baltobacteraceae bacterium]|nr:hypothetical protein [Candidatus Baltobacteraceae bacterium]